MHATTLTMALTLLKKLNTVHPNKDQFSISALSYLQLAVSSPSLGIESSQISKGQERITWVDSVDNSSRLRVHLSESGYCRGRG